MSPMCTGIWYRSYIWQQTNRIIKKIVKNYFLRRIIADSYGFTAQEFNDCIEHNELKVEQNGLYLIVVMKIDNYAEYIQRHNYNQQKLFHFAISNIADEVISNQFQCETADMKSDHLVILVSTVSTFGENSQDIIGWIAKVQEIVQSYYKLSISMTLSEVFSNHKHIAEQYGLALQHSMYKLLFGKRAIITPAMVQKNVEHTDYNCPPELERKLIDGLKANDVMQMEDAIVQLIEQTPLFILIILSVVFCI